MSLNIKPLADRVLIEPAEAETKTASGIIIPDNAKEKPQRGKVIATVNPSQEDDDEVAFQARLVAYKNGGIQIHDDIVDKPLKQYDHVDDSHYSSSIAAEPNE